MCCKVLHKSGELDDNLQPIGKEGFRASEPDWNNFELEKEDADIVNENLDPRPGTTRRRQYYYKRVSLNLQFTTVFYSINNAKFLNISFRLHLFSPIVDQSLVSNANYISSKWFWNVQYPKSKIHVVEKFMPPKMHYKDLAC